MNRATLTWPVSVLSLAALGACGGSYETADAVRDVNRELNTNSAKLAEGLNEAAKEDGLSAEAVAKGRVTLACPGTVQQGIVFRCSLSGRFIKPTSIRMKVNERGDLDSASDGDATSVVVSSINEQLAAAFVTGFRAAGLDDSVADGAGIELKCPPIAAGKTETCSLSGKMSGRSSAVRMTTSKSGVFDFDSYARSGDTIGSISGSETAAALKSLR